MINHITISLFIRLFIMPLNAENIELQHEDIVLYKQMNDEEKRLAEFKDSDDILLLKLKQIDVINRSRKKYRAQPVKLDILASRVANRMCREAAENNYISHWNLAGEKPYHRYAFSGGYDHISENAYGEWTSGTYDTSTSSILQMMNKGHNVFMSEKAPNDGHKKNIIDKTHNFAGIGLYISGGQFRYYEEFINRYLDFSNIPSGARPGEKITITADTRGLCFPYFMIVYRESFPVPRSLAQLKRTGSYEDYSDEVFLSMPAWEISRFRHGTKYEIPIVPTREGLYYIHIYTDQKEYTGTGPISTKGRSPVSGIVIRVR